MLFYFLSILCSWWGGVVRFRERKGKKKIDEEKTSTPAVVPLPTMVDKEYSMDVEKSRRNLRTSISNQDCAADMIGLSIAEAATYNSNTKTGGPNGSIRFGEEYNYCIASGLQKCLELCDLVKRSNPRITYADLYQLAGVVSIELCGGPTIPFIPGRKDFKDSDIAHLLPNPNLGAAHLKQVFNRMGLDVRDIVTLSKALSMVRRSGTERIQLEDGISEESPTVFDNTFFRDLLQREGSLHLESEKALVTDPELRRYVVLYAKDEEAFFRDYAISHQRLSELGFRVNQVQTNQMGMTRKVKVVAATSCLLGVVVGLLMAPGIILFLLIIGHLFK